jgi:hypothetical protein
MKTSTVLKFTDLADLCRYLKVIHASSYRIIATNLTVKLSLTPFEAAVALEQYNATILEQLEMVS